MPDCLKKATRLRETLSLPSCNHQIKEITSTMPSRWDHGVGEEEVQTFVIRTNGEMHMLGGK